MSLRHLPKFKSSRHLADDFLNFNESPGAQAPHLVGQLTTEELISVSVRGTLSKTSKKLLTQMNCRNATALVIDMLVSGQYPDEVAPLTSARGFEEIAKEKGYAIVGSGNAFSFLCWNDPESILINQDGTSQIDWESMCSDLGVHLNDFSWNISDGEFSPTADAMDLEKDYDFSPPLKSFAQYGTDRRPNASVLLNTIAKLLHSNKSCQSTQSHEYALNASAWLMEASYPRGNTQGLLSPYVNHDFVPEGCDSCYPTFNEAAQGACMHFIQTHMNHSRDPEAMRQQLLMLQAPQQFSQFVSINSDLGDLLRRYGEQVLFADEINIWCIRGNTPPEKTSAITQILINHYPDMLDEAIEVFHPGAANRIAREARRLPQLDRQRAVAVEFGLG